MTEPDDVHARPKIIGARIKRTEDPRLLTGLGSFVDDRQVSRVLHVAFRRSDHSHARIRAIDSAAARAAPGVVAVLTAEDLASLVKPLLATSRMAGYYATPILPLAHGKVRYVGEPVVGVVAESRYLAEDALELIAIDFEPLPAIVDPAQAARAGAPLLHEEAGTNVLVARGPRRIRAGSRRADSLLHDADSRHRAQRTGGGARPAGPPAAGGGTRRRRRLRRQGLALPRGDFRLRRRTASGALGQMDQRPHGGSLGQQPSLRRDRGRGARPRSRWAGIGAARRRHRRRWGLFDLSLDGRSRAGPGRQLSARPLSHPALCRPRQGGGDLEGADRSLSGCGTTDRHVRHGAADGHGGRAARHRSGGHPRAQLRPPRGISL